MSRAAIALGVRNQIRAPADDLTYPGLGPVADQLNAAYDVWKILPEECDVTLLGQPPPICGERFIGVYTGGRTNQQPNAGLDELYTVNVVITLRLPRVPFDRIGTEIITKAAVGLDALADALRALIGKDYIFGSCRTKADSIIGAQAPINTSVLGFVQGLYYLGESDPEPVGGTWFHAEEDEGLAGVVVRQRYGGARRVQTWIAEEHDLVT